MVKGDDVVKRKKNKANRKKLNKQQNDSSKVSARIASIIAAKKRRKSGKRRMCQGMCFSLPTPDDPFNDKQGKIDFKKKEKRKVVKGKTTVPNKESFGKRNTEDNHLEQTDEMSKLSRGATRTSLSGNTGQEGRTDLERSKIQLVGEVGAHGHQKPDQEILEYPSKFLMMCLNEIENALHKSGILDSEKEKPFFFNTWGVEFWKQVVDQLQSLYRDGCLDALKSIKQAISGRPQTVVFSDGFNHRCISAVQILLNESICRLSLNDSVASQGACIIQSVNVCASNEERLVKCVEVLDKAYGENLQLLKVLCIVKKNGKFKKLGPALKLKGYCLSTQEYDLTSEVKRSLDSDDRVRPVVSMINTDQISSTSLEEYDIIILPEFVPAIQNYVQILTRMARCTVKGALHSFLTEDDALQAGPLVEILEKCGQAVPEALRKLCCTQPVFES
ncbi:pre-mRNA-processing ATP-dependent RNA helicase prp5 [Carica papaya]|uniref:pre-mRNA-processing ATP-dependent RNA helicase prp5 n=1 Tax=Carica papaya TaxID=3649 RepID=UPI000B8CC0E1|nr:pre-mRNA-processing ATP-dependent RNA helicase prp5 [Carica papaya]